MSGPQLFQVALIIQAGAVMLACGSVLMIVSVLDAYLHALGMIPENPLAVAVGALAVDAMAREQVLDAFKQMVPAGGELIARVGGEPVRIWRDAGGIACLEPYVAPAAPTAAPGPKAGRGAKRSATVLELVPKDDPVKAAADRAERIADKKRRPADENPSNEDSETEDEPV